MQDKIYTCKCGKTFTKPNSFNAHKSHCKEIIGDEGVAKRNKQAKIASDIANNKKSNDAKSNKQTLMDLLISEQHTCKRCGRIMLMKFGSGRFCSRSCANSHDRTNESKNKTSITLKQVIKDGGLIGESSCKKYYRGYYDNAWFDSSYELIYYLYCKEHNINIIRNRTVNFTYIY